MLKIKIQSFGDLITNSSSEVYCIYDIDGVEQIKNAINAIAKALNPDINVEDHLEIYISLDDNRYFYDENDNDLSGSEYYEKEYNRFCENRTNEQILSDFPKWYKQFFIDNCTDYKGRPNLTIEFNAKDKLGETLQNAIEKILYAFNYVEVYDG